MPGALEGVRVLDCTQIIAGPLAGSLLSEMGADVVKVEPLEGEPWRLQAEIIPKESKAYLSQNRGKRGLALDFKAAGAAPVRDALIRWADVLLTNYRPGVPESLGIDYESARKIRPDIIYAENTAFGKLGPDANRRGYDIVAQAMSGLTTSNPNLQNGLPMQVGFAPADVMSGIALAWGITAALYHREKTGEGQALNTSLLLTALTLQAGSKEILAMDEEPRERRRSAVEAARARGANIETVYAERRALMPELAGNVYYRPYQTKDSYIAVGCLGPGPRARFREALQFHDPRYDSDFDPARLKEVAAGLVATCEAKFLEHPNDYWIPFLDSRDIAAGPVRFIEEMWNDPQVVANEFLEEYDHTLLGPLRGPAPIIRMTGTPTRIQRAAPALGEHTADILAEVGFTAEQIASFQEQSITN
ncbi:CoA transferase [Candidatus Amarobacter glycogenicus]|uniref:CaiB/BaiF CoA transferase family protein n=1 Tax=Candidatus Amarobacter glycogenicus TaxID=3140699 RepID=UPI003136F042|nr:CoA transferase [Dehalococcoidia bacterium]